MSRLVVEADVSGEVLVCDEGLSFWGGVDPATGRIIDAHHPQCGASLGGKVVMMPTSRGSCSGSGVLLELALNGCAPAALIFREAEEVLTLGALVAAEMFDLRIAIARLSAEDYASLKTEKHVAIREGRIEASGARIEFDAAVEALELAPEDLAALDGAQGAAAALAMRVVVAMAEAQGASRLIDVTRGHIDGCILHSDANLIFAETMRDMGAKVRIPTTINAISVDMARWRDQGVAPDFGLKAQRLAEAYVAMGARATFTCAPYQVADAPEEGEAIGWSESNAVIYANSVLGARTTKHADYLDLFIALTGRAPETGVYLDENRRPGALIEVDAPETADDAFWPLLGWLAGRCAPDRVPLLKGVAHLQPGEDDLRALCAAFGTTSAAPMLHVDGVTPEADRSPVADAPVHRIGVSDFADAWRAMNAGGEAIDLVALGSPHFSLNETRRFDGLLVDRAKVPTIITLSRETRDAAEKEGLDKNLIAKGVQFVVDLCWCSITEPVFPPDARTVMTNSGKYAHYGPGLSGREMRFGSLAVCAEAAATGRSPLRLPRWLEVD